MNAPAMNIRTPFVSVIVPVFNAEKYVGEAIDSIFAQGYAPLEVIVVDDASTDGTLKQLETFGDAIRVISLPANSGPAAARNVGLRHARGEVIGFLDADDLWLPGFIEHVLPCITEQGYECARGSAQLFRDLDDGTREFTPRLVLETQVGTALYRKSLVDNVGPFDESMRYGEDVDWWKRMQEAGAKGTRLERVVLLYRRHKHNMTNREHVIREGLREGLMDAFRKRVARTRSGKNA